MACRCRSSDSYRFGASSVPWSQARVSYDGGPQPAQPRRGLRAPLPARPRRWSALAAHPTEPGSACTEASGAKLANLAVEFVDQTQAGLDGPLPQPADHRRERRGIGTSLADRSRYPRSHGRQGRGRRSHPAGPPRLRTSSWSRGRRGRSGGPPGSLDYCRATVSLHQEATHPRRQWSCAAFRRSTIPVAPR
jgi:hypothetical protein